MKLSKLIKFRHIKTQKLTRLQIVMRLCIILGVVFLLGAAASLAFLQHEHTSGIKTGAQSFPFTEYITVETTDVPVYISESEDENIHISYVSDTEISITEQNGRLIIEQIPDFVIPLFSLEAFSRKIEIALPKTHYKSVNLYTAAARITCGELDAHAVGIKCKSGGVEIKKLSCGGIFTMENDTGSSEIGITAFSSGKLKNSSGEINFSFSCPVNAVVSSGSRCYVNGVAASASADTSQENSFIITSPSGRVRINKPD